MSSSTSPPPKWLPLVAISLGVFMLQLDVTIVVVALPAMAHDLDASFAGLQWVLDAYALALAATLLAFGALADRFGLRRVTLLGLLLFALASAGCALSPGAGLLIGMRAVQGIGAAMIFATSTGLLSSAYAGRDRGVAFGVWGAVSGGGAAAGPVLGGLITDHLGWPWIFAVNVPVCALAIWLTRTSVRESDWHDKAIDLAGTISFALAAFALVFGIVRGGEDGWGSPPILAAFAVAAVAAVVFVTVELRREHPMLDLRLFRRPPVVGLVVGGLLLQGAAFGYMPYTSLWLQRVLGMSPVDAGLVILSQATMAFLVAGIGGRLLHGVPHRLTIGGGLLLISAGLFLQTGLDAAATGSTLIPGLLVAGVGVGLALPVQAQAMMGTVPPHRFGMAGGALNTFRQLGFALAVAAFGAISTARLDGALAAGSPPRGAWASALSTVYVVAGVVALAAAVLSIALLGRPGRSVTDERGSATTAARTP